MSLFSSFIDLLYPNLCGACGDTLIKGETCICTKCLSEIPKTNYHLMNENPVEKRFWGKAPVETASAYFFFQKGSKFQHLLHEIKYKGTKELGAVLGSYAAADLLQNADFASVDLIVPVPLHPKRQQKRGYNQSEWICKGMSAVMEKPVSTENLIRAQENTSQVRKSVYQRYENTQGIFEVRNPAEFRDKHLLLVDDVLTTGSTLEACIQALTHGSNVKVSVFTLALAI